LEYPLARSVEVAVEGKRPDLWADTLGRVGISSAQLLLVLTVVVVSV
jgi:hypothetical protein